MKFVCNECDKIFEEDEAIYEEERDTGEGGYGGVIYSWPTCPHCGSECLNEAEECPVCHDDFNPDEGEICALCKKDISALWLNLLSNLPNADVDAVVTYIAEVLA